MFLLSNATNSLILWNVLNISYHILLSLQVLYGSQLIQYNLSYISACLRTQVLQSFLPTIILALLFLIK
jgi:hypothetical protein